LSEDLEKYAAKYYTKAGNDIIYGGMKQTKTHKGKQQAKSP
jgi:hypothetical protein